MLDPRIYRTGLIIAALALVVLAFSLRDQQGPMNPTLAPDAFNGHNVYSAMQILAGQDPIRRPGSYGDSALAAQVSATFDRYGFTPTTSTFRARTVDGTRTLENVVGVRPGMKGGSIVIVAARDSLGTPGVASLSGTATLMELASDLNGETLNHTVVLASTSGSNGTGGAIQLARTLPHPIDAVLVLGDLASSHVNQPVVIPWSARQTVAPTVLRNTVASALTAQTPLTAQGVGLGGQFVHLAFPFTLGQQAPFNAGGIPAVELSLSGEHAPGADAPTSLATVTAMGRTVLQAISALDGGSAVPAPSSYLLLSGKLVPGWAVSLFVLALLVPVALTTVDGVARARRRGHIIWRSLVLILTAAVPFISALVVVLAARLLGVIAIAPPAPVPAGAVPLQGSGITVLILAALAFVGSGIAVAFAARRIPGRAAVSRGRAAARSGGEGAVAGLLVVMCAVTFAIWLSNPFAALLVVPALHLWLWAVNPDLRLPLAFRGLLIAAGLAPAALVVIYYANGLGYGPLGAVWQAVLMLAGHGVSLVAALEWCLLLGCLAGALTLAVLGARRSRVVPVPVTVRGPVTYAGPGSLGGTKSALRR
ncbi:MAG TPA: hypothetical protein VG325_05435 [Solirubrobacteraceae bacterium]|jgi:hypothetical protein|nr:hypothetical protein [Solirubrobacteraceae bacterium]